MVEKSREITAVIIGVGQIAGGYDHHPTEVTKHSGALSHVGAMSIFPEYSVLATIDPDFDKRNVFNLKWNIPNGFDDFDNFVKSRINPDLFIIASGTESHEYYLKKIIDIPEKNKPTVVIAEKPLVNDVGRCLHWYHEYRKNGILLLVNYPRLFNQTFLKIFSEKNYGEFCHIDGWFSGSMRHSGSHMLSFICQYLPEIESVDFFDGGKGVCEGKQGSFSLCQRGRRAGEIRSIDVFGLRGFELTVCWERAVLHVVDWGRYYILRVSGADYDLPKPHLIETAWRFSMPDLYRGLVRVILFGEETFFDRQREAAVRADEMLFDGLENI